MGFRESFGLQGQGFRVWAGVWVVGALRLTTSRQDSHPKTNPPTKQKRYLGHPFFGTGSNRETNALIGIGLNTPPRYLVPA